MNFSGGQLYVVCSRVRCRAAFGAVVGTQNVSGNKTVLAANVVYTELLDVISDCGKHGLVARHILGANDSSKRGSASHTRAHNI